MKKIICLLLCMQSVLLFGCEKSDASSIATESVGKSENSAISYSTSLEETTAEQQTTVADSWSQKATPAADFEIEVNGSNAKILKYLGSEDDIVIPKQIFGYTVTSISQSAFSEKEINSVEIPNTIEEFEELKNGPSNGYRLKVVFEKPLLPESGDNFEYVISGGGIKLMKYNGRESNLWIPDVINGFPVVELDSNLFDENTIFAIHLPDTIETIGYSTFYHINTQSLTIPISVKTVKGEGGPIAYSISDGMFAFDKLGYFSASQKLVNMFNTERDKYEQVYFRTYLENISWEPIIKIIS